MKPRSSRIPLITSALFAVITLTPAAYAANAAWNTDAATGDFGSPNWTSGVTVPAAGGTYTVLSGDALFFGTSTTTTLNNDLSDATYAGLTFNSGASAFTIGGNSFTLNGNITNSSSSLQTINNDMTSTAARTFTGGTGGLTLGGSYTTTIAATYAGVINIKGATIISQSGANNQGFATIGNGTNSTLTLSNDGSLTINGTTAGTKPNSIIANNLSTSVLNVGASDQSSSGTLTVGAETGFVLGNNNTSANGTLNINSGTATINRGSTTATDIRSFVSLGRDTGTGTINLNGGTLATDRNFIRDGSSGADVSGAANFNFAGGTLQALANQTDWLNSSTKNTNQLELSAVTATGTSTIDANGFSVAINSNISGTGGFNIISSSGTGSGVVTLGGANTYAGTTSVTGGTLALTGSVAGPVSVSTAGSLAVGEATPSTNMAAMSLGSLSLGSGGSIKFDVTSPSSNDQLTVTTASGLSISGGSIALYDAGTTNALTQTGTYTLIHYSGTLTGSASELTVANSRVGYAYVFDNTGSAITVTVSLTDDTDGDGMPDVYEDANGLNKLVNDANGNLDGDFSTNYEEYLAGTDPQNAASDVNNSDNDGLADDWEMFYFSNLSQTGGDDADGDYATNAQEQAADTDPTNRLSAPDADNDDMGDAWEIHYFGDTETADDTTDFDSDGYSDSAEFDAGSSPIDAFQTPDDMDADGLGDSWEMLYFGNLDQTAFDDPDGDFGDNLTEHEDGTDPNDRLSTVNVDDGTPDGMGDYWEEWFFGNTLRDGTGDFDNDGVSDLAEWTGNSDPDDALDPYSGVTSVVWNAPVTVTSNNDILTTGSLVHAGNFRSDNANVTVIAGSESIPFANRPAQNAAGDLQTGEEARVIAGAGGRQVNAALFDSTGLTISTAFESVLDGSAWENADAGPAPGATDMVLRVTGAGGTTLVEGQEYQIQLFYSDDRPTSNTRAQRYHDGKGNASDSFLASSSSAVVGTFTATSAGYMDIYIQNTSGEANFPVGLNAYVLRTVASGNDSDSDGMDDTWETTYFGNTSQSATGDFDGDGTDNLTEFRLGLIPNDGSSRFAIVTSDNALSDGYTITWQGKAGLNFTVERSTTLAAGSWTNLTPTPQSGVDGTNTFIDPAPVPTGKAFYRVILEP